MSKPINSLEQHQEVIQINWNQYEVYQPKSTANI